MLSLLGLVLASASTASAERQIDLVLALDTTGSMGGLIERAKAELWRIVDQLAAADPDVRIRLGLVAFRDRGDAYVTQVHALSPDIDAAYGRLLEFQAAGGGDTPEAVNQALFDAVDRVGWDRCPNVDRAIILAGDAPPHMDYDDEVQWPATVRNARARGIAIHTIACGGNAQTQQVWQKIAQAGDGRYAQLSARPARAMGSPWDAQLAALSSALSKTVVPYGTEAMRDQLRESAARTAAADVATAAARASYLGRVGAAGTSAEGDLVSHLAEHAGEDFDWNGFDLDALPPDLREQAPERVRQHLEDQLARRTGLLSEVAYYAEKRDAFLSREQERQRAQGGVGGFSHEVVAALAARSVDPELTGRPASTHREENCPARDPERSGTVRIPTCDRNCGASSGG